MPDGVNTGQSPKQAQDALDFYLNYVTNLKPGHDELADRLGPFNDIGDYVYTSASNFSTWGRHEATAVHDILVVSLMVAILFTLSAKCMFAVQTSRNLTKQRLERQRLVDQAEPAAHVAHEEEVFQAPLPANDVLFPNEVPLQNDVSLQTDMPLQHNNTPRTMLANMERLAAATSQLQCHTNFYKDMQVKLQLWEMAETKIFEDAVESDYAKHMTFVEQQINDQGSREFCRWRYFQEVHPGATFAQFGDHQEVSRATQHKFDKERNECMQKHFDASIASYDAYIRGVADRNAKNRARNADLESMSDAVLARMLAQRGV